MGQKISTVQWGGSKLWVRELVLYSGVDLKYGSENQQEVVLRSYSL